MAACTECGAQVTFCTTVNGKKTIINALPHPKGDQVVIDGQVRKATEQERASGAPLFISHFATCTNPGRFRKR